MNSDFLIHAPDGTLAAAIDVKNHKSMSLRMAIELRRHKWSEGLLPPADYYVLLSQDVGFIWAHQRDAGPDAPPSIEFSTAAIIESYVPSLAAGARLDNAALELVVRAWLDDVNHQEHHADAVEQQLARIGFLDAIRNGTWLWETV